MADKCVSVKADVKKIFDKDLTKAVCEQLKSTIEAAVNKTKGLVFDKNCKEGWFLTATIVLLDVDDPANPKSMEVKVQIDGVELGGAASSFKANGSGKMSGVRAKKIEDDAKGLVNDVVDDLMKDKVIPAIK
jgi:hypothetical protein